MCNEFLWVIIIAVLVACPLAYWMMNKWLQEYAYRIDITAQPFVVAVFCLGAITVIIICMQTIKAAFANPVKAYAQNKKCGVRVTHLCLSNLILAKIKKEIIKLKNYLLTAFRSFKKNKLTTLINVFGLSIGISAALIVTPIINNK